LSAAQVEQGRYASVSEVGQAGLKMLEEAQTHVASLCAALIEGEESGPAESFDVEAFLIEMRAERQIAE